MLKRILEASRFLLVLPVIGSLLLTVAVVVMGLGIIVVRGWELVRNPEFNEGLAKVLSVSVIQAIDLFLVGALGYIHGRWALQTVHQSARRTAAQANQDREAG